MSITKIINDENITLVQGVDGICLCEESWATEGLKKKQLNYLDIENDILFASEGADAVND